MTRARVWGLVRRVWITLGIGATVVFVTWSLLAYRASGAARAALETDEHVRVERTPGHIRFAPLAAAAALRSGLLFIPGALVDPAAYAPLARAAAEAGHGAIIVPLPRRGAFGGAEAPDLSARLDSLLTAAPPGGWVVAGHSRGGVIASSLAARGARGISALVLIGTSHPRDVDLSGLSIPVLKVVGTHDGLASRPEVEANARLLPAATRWLWLEGGNHSQFGWYGFQPGDRRATLPRDQQQRMLVEAVVAFLDEAAAAGAGDTAALQANDRREAMGSGQ